MLRVTQRTMYSTMVNQMNNSLASYMGSQEQGSTLKKVNKPSDDPAGMARILKYRATIDRTTQLESSSDSALGWLQLADTTLGNTVSSLLGSNIIPLAEQAATDTYTAENRKQIAKQLREYMGTLINVSNTRYEDKCIFAGQNYNGSAFVEGLNVTSANWGSDQNATVSSPNPPFQVEGTLTTTAVVRFSQNNSLTRGDDNDPLSWKNHPAVERFRKLIDPNSTETLTEQDKELLNKIVDPTGKTTIDDPDFANGNWKTTKYQNIVDVKKSLDTADTVIKSPGATDMDISDPDWKNIQKLTYPAGSSSNPSVELLREGTAYEYSLDSGKTWKTDYVQDRDGALTMQVSSAVIVLPKTRDYQANGTQEPLVPAQPNSTQKLYVNEADPEKEAGEKNGTMLYVRPTAIYQGSDNNALVRIDPYGQINFPKDIATSVDPNETFTTNTLVKFENGVPDNKVKPNASNVSANDTVNYKYSVDGGANWITGTATITIVTNSTTSTNNLQARLVLPQGHLDLTWDANNEAIPAGAQLSIKPQRTDLSFTIMDGQTITVNNVGKDVFGGLYKSNYGDVLEPAFGENDGQNLFETLGRLIGYCETNNCNGIGNCLADLKLSQNNILLHATTIGGKENRLEATIQNLDDNKFAQQTRMSTLEDVDITELMVRLTQQQMSYQTVLQSSSMIMNLSLANYLS